MFFYLSKTFWFFAQPSGMLLVMLVAGSVLAYCGRHQAARRLLAASATLLLVGGLLPLSNWLILPLEQRFARADLRGGDIAGIVVLGGAEDARIALDRGAHALNEAGERFTEAMGLARRYPDARIAFTGGSIEIVGTPKVGAEAARLMFRDLGLMEGDRLVLETKARDTWENATFTRALVHPKPGERWLLVTSAWHMPRAMGVFRKAGFAVEPWPVDYRTASNWDALRMFEAPADGLKRLDTVMREWIGLASYRLSGRSDALFPAPD